MTLDQHTTTTNGVGVPLAERRLTRALDAEATHVLPPGPGRSLLHLREVELGTGRPDSILIVLSMAGLQARRHARLRLPSLAHARVLDAIRVGKSAGYSASHIAQLTSELRESDWICGNRRVRNVSNLIHRSLTIEAKMADWRTGIGQLSKARWASHEAALLMPYETQHRVPRRTLRHNRLGLLVVQDGEVRYRIQPRSLELSWMADIWLTELAIRFLEAHDAQRSSSATNR